jgi:hypothetical protein
MFVNALLPGIVGRAARRLSGGLGLAMVVASPLWWFAQSADLAEVPPFGLDAPRRSMCGW